MRKKKKAVTEVSKLGRPRLYPNPVTIAREFAISSRSFDTEAWEIKETGRNITLHGLYHLRDKNDNIKEKVPFKLLVPKAHPEPRKNITIRFPYTNHYRHLSTYYGLRDKIEGIYFEIINKEV